MEEHLYDVYEKTVDIDPERGRRSVLVLTRFTDLFLSGMLNEEPSLVSMCPRAEFLGSYFEGLKICAPDEFDVNIALTLPYDAGDITMVADERIRSVASVSLPDDEASGLVGTWCKGNGKISAGRFREWMIDLGARVLHSMRMMNPNGELYTVTLEDTGVAMTMVLADKTGFSMSVDVVIAFQFSLPKVPLRCKLDLAKVRETGIMDYFLIPLKEYDWRITMSSQEKFLLEGHKCKYAMKLVKYICQIYNINMFSYVIKTLFLRSNVKPSSNLTDQVIFILEILQGYLFSGAVPSYWFLEDNLILDILVDTLKSWLKKLTKILEYLRSDSELCSGSIFGPVILIEE